MGLIFQVKLQTIAEPTYFSIVTEATSMLKSKSVARYKPLTLAQVDVI